MTAAPPIRLRLLGTVPYTEALTRMRQWTAARQAARPPVVPARRAGNATGTGGRPHLTLVGSGRSWSHAPCTPSAAGAAAAADSPTSLTRPALCLNWPELHDAATAGDEIWLMQHPPVFTLGMNSQPGHLLDPGDIPVVPTERGGQITYHGPGQIMAYLMLDLRTRKLGIRVLVERIENALIQCLMHYGVTAIRQAGAPGIYVLPRHPAQAFVQPFEALQACSGSAGLPMAGSAQVTSPAKAACTGSATGPNGALRNSGASTITGMAHAGASLNFPTNPEYGSLNLAMAVQLAAYEVRMAYLSNQQAVENTQNFAKHRPLAEAEKDYPNAEALEHFYQHTERLYKALGFIRNDAVMLKLRRLYQRAELETNELNLLRGMLTAVECSQKESSNTP